MIINLGAGGCEIIHTYRRERNESIVRYGKNVQ
jgi:hypothetical protein